LQIPHTIQSWGGFTAWSFHYIKQHFITALAVFLNSLGMVVQHAVHKKLCLTGCTHPNFTNACKAPFKLMKCISKVHKFQQKKSVGHEPHYYLI
jgi:hypothetical protein